MRFAFGEAARVPRVSASPKPRGDGVILHCAGAAFGCAEPLLVCAAFAFGNPPLVCAAFAFGKPPLG